MCVADFLAEGGVTKFVQWFKEQVNPVLSDIGRWMKSHILQLVHQKTKVVMLIKKGNFYTLPRMKIGDHLIAPNNRVTLDKRLSFNKYVETVVKKEFNDTDLADS